MKSIEQEVLDFKQSSATNNAVFEISAEKGNLIDNYIPNKGI